MAVDPNIKKKADDIRNKIYGKEVRESLASGLEAMSSDVVENEGRQSVVEGRQDSVESQWQAVSDEMTDKDVISAPEIIAARNGEANLKARLDKENQEVTAWLAQTMPNEVFYDIETKKFRHTNGTDYYITVIPNTIKPKIGIANNEVGTLQSTIDFARMSKSAFCINAGIFDMESGEPRGIVLQEGSIVKDETFTNSNSPEVLAFDSEGVMNSFESATTTASDLLNLGYMNAVQGWFPIIKDGAYLNNRDTNNFQPVQIIGQTENNEYVILTSDGRTQYDKGLNMLEASNILLGYGVTFAYNLDGGGSVSTVTKMIKQNKNIDEMVEDRKVSTFIYFAKDLEDNNLFDAFNEIAKLKQETNNDIVKLRDFESGFIRLKSPTGSHYPGIEYYPDGRDKRIGKTEVSVENGHKLTLDDGNTEQTVFQATLDGLYDIKGQLADMHRIPTLVEDCDAVRGTGIFKTNVNTLNTPISISQGYLFNFDYDGDENANCVQIFFGRDTPSVFYRQITASGQTTAWINYLNKSTSTEYRADTTKILSGYTEFDTTLGKPIWWTGSEWVDASGEPV